jgi:gluconate 2-dehydrogenase gamma chain
MTFISRRDLLKTAALPVARGFQPGGRSPDGLALHADARPADNLALQAREPLENLTAAEMDVLEAVVARLIPTDANGPGAAEARAARYIDRALGGALSASRQAYTAGLAALDRHAQALRGAPFRQLPPADQDAVLTDIEKGAAAGFSGSSSTFFNMLLNHTHQGTFGDPYYGGNAKFVGWDLIGYPGVRTMVSPDDQHRLESNQLKPNHKSAYEYDLFTKASARRSSRAGEDTRGE